MDGFANDAKARATLAQYARWTSDCAVDPIAIPDGANVEIVAALFQSLVAGCRAARFIACAAETQRLAAELGLRLQETYEVYLRGRVEHARTEELDVEAALALARLMMGQRRLTDAAQIYSKLANALRTRSDYLALAHYARGRHLLDQGARAEARMELTRALTLDPSLAEAQVALDSMQTRELRRL